MHPFALNDELLDLVNGAGIAGGIVENPLTPIAPLPGNTKPGLIEETTQAIGEEGGCYAPPPLDLM